MAIELDESELEEYADLWGVDVDEVEDLFEAMGDVDFEDMALDDVREYIDSLYEALEAEGWDGDISDLWDMYYGYEPGS